MTADQVATLGQALVWLSIALVARNAFQLWLKHVADQRAIERAQRRGLLSELSVVQHVPRGTTGTSGTHGGTSGTNGGGSRLAAPGELPRNAAPIVLPDDLEAHVMQWDDIWARDDERASVRQTFLQLYNGDVDATWQKVRRSIGIGELP